MRRKYYSLRMGKLPDGGELPLVVAKSLVFSLYMRLSDGGYFQEHFGYTCVDRGNVDGRLGADIKSMLRFHLRRDIPWPFPEGFEGLTEDAFFDLVEFLHDHVSKPLDGWVHEFSGCGWHYHTFDAAAGQAEFRDEVNSVLEDYGTGYALSGQGEMLGLSPRGLEPLLSADVPTQEGELQERVRLAIAKFRRHRSTLSERRDAVRDLSDVLEFVRPQLKQVLAKKDEAALFEIANQFSIRHHNPTQRSDYDQSIWLSWIFYFYLATIHAALRMIEKSSRSSR